MRKTALLLAAVLVLTAAFTAQVLAAVIFADDFESYVGGNAPLDKNYAGGANYAPNGSGQPWFGPAPPNARVIGTENGITPHSGSQMLRGSVANDKDENWVNIAYRFNNGNVYYGGIYLDWWFYDPLGAGGSACSDFGAIGYYNTAPTDTDYPGTGSLNTGVTVVQRLSLGCYATGDSNVYQARIVGASDGYSYGWFNTTTPRSIGWHKMRVVVFPTSSGTAGMVAFYIDDMNNPITLSATGGPVQVHSSVMTYGYNVIEINTNYGATSAYFDDVTFGTLETTGRISEIKAQPVGSFALLGGKRITAAPGAGVPDGNVFVEETDRTTAIRVHGTLPTGTGALGKGDEVAAIGTVAVTPDGEKYIEAASISAGATNKPIDALGMTNRDAARPNALGLFVKTWGKVSSVGADSFVISDGSPTPIKVMCGALTKPAVDDKVRVRGVAYRDESGPTLLMRNEQVDWTSMDATYQPLPFVSAFEYVHEWLILGPFADATSPTDETYRLDHDFISDATGGVITETTLATAAPPSPGATLAGKTWTRSNGNGAHVVFAPVGAADYSTYYGHIWLYSPVDQDAGARIGSDDSSKVMLYNDVIRGMSGGPALVMYETAPIAGRGEVWGQDPISWIPLNAGWNSILVKCENGTGAFALDFQIVPTTGMGVSGWGGAAPLPGLAYMLYNPTL